ncbi:MAG: hypothetical protein H7276_17020 [Caulobacter sp.]|nr:hypothetical protein [Vitreoscilla sp.]
MGRLMIWVLLGFIAWMLLRPKRGAAPPPDAARGPATPKAPAAKAEAMVDCAACGLHFPGSEAIHDGARLYCCTAHRDTGPRRGD